MDVFEDWDLWMRYASVQQPVTCGVVTSEFKKHRKIPWCAHNAGRLLKQAKHISLRKPKNYSLHTSMGEIADHVWYVDARQNYLREHAQEFSRRRICGGGLCFLAVHRAAAGVWPLAGACGQLFYLARG